MSKHGIIVTTFMWGAIVCLLGCGKPNHWELSEMSVIKTKILEAEAWGTVKLVEGDASEPAKIEFRLRDQNGTILHIHEDEVGQEIENQGDAVRFKVKPSDRRLGLSSGQYPYACFQVKLSYSNFDNWTDFGCIVAD